MKNTMTYSVALSTAIDAMKDTNPEVAERLSALREQMTKRSERSDEVKAKQNEQRKAKTAAARAELVAQVVPALRAVIDHDMTAKEIFEAAKDSLPADFTAMKVQNILLREMADELIKTEAKNKANTYRMKEGA